MELVIPAEWESEIQKKFQIEIKELESFKGDVLEYLGKLSNFIELFELESQELYEDCANTNNRKFYDYVENFFNDRCNFLNLLDELSDF